MTLSAKELYAQVIVPRPLDGAFTYRVPQAMQNVKKGCRVIVPFGNKKFVTGVVEAVSIMRPEGVKEIKEIVDVLDQTPLITSAQIRLWHWLADYYICAVGDVFKAALPGGLKLESESIVEATEEPSPDTIQNLSKDDFELYSAITATDKPQPLNGLAKKMGRSSVEGAVGRLVEKGLISIHETIGSRYHRIKIQQAVPTFDATVPEQLNAAFDKLKRSKAQQKALTVLIGLSEANNPLNKTHYVDRKSLLEVDPDVTWENFVALKKKGIIEIATQEVSRFAAIDSTPLESARQLPKLSKAQSGTLDDIRSSFKDKNVTLLRGITSSGKTEIYIHLIEEALSQGRQALMLVPEIALTTQLTRRLQRVFGKRVIIYHSKFSDNERIDIWRDMISNPSPCVVIGARSAVFLPYSNLGLVIVDEEHESSYKQYDPAPRYNGRDAAIVLASMFGAKTLLGSATPAIETYYKAKTGKYGLVELLERFGDAPLPYIEVVNLAEEIKKKATKDAFSLKMLSEARESLKNGRQVIFFHNRRGFSPRARCQQCQYVPKCDHCDVALTFHKFSGTLECHYCGATYSVPTVCPNCHEPAVRIVGYGTERVEEGVEENFPQAKILRMDTDTTRNKNAYANIIDDFSSHKADILIGTQMVTKGLDFGDVGMVGIVNADNVINYPDFRSNERAFNMLEQVSGRAGRRKDSPGKVLIQTFNPNQPVIDFVRNHDYIGFYEHELSERRQFAYPPFSRIINLYIKHKDETKVAQAAEAYGAELRQRLGNRVNGPVKPAISKIANWHIRVIMLRIETNASVSVVKQILRETYIKLSQGLTSPGIVLYYDVDPV